MWPIRKAPTLVNAAENGSMRWGFLSYCSTWGLMWTLIHILRHIAWGWMLEGCKATTLTWAFTEWTVACKYSYVWTAKCNFTPVTCSRPDARWNAMDYQLRNLLKVHNQMIGHSLRFHRLHFTSVTFVDSAYGIIGRQQYKMSDLAHKMSMLHLRRYVRRHM